jgi:hypothetical protein
MIYFLNGFCTEMKIERKHNLNFDSVYHVINVHVYGGEIYKEPYK